MRDDSNEENHECKDCYCYPISLRLLIKCLQCVACYYFLDNHSLSLFMKNGYNNIMWNLTGKASDLFTIFVTSCTLFLFVTVRQWGFSAVCRHKDYIFTSCCVVGFVILLLLHLTWILSSTYDSFVDATIAEESPIVLLAIIAMFFLDNRLAARDLHVNVAYSKKSIINSSQIRV
ncbi:hypothetical protein ANCCAN_23976 [Ancylostoma caninum]|uniref:Uncharacterized protein n=1 Tax=Ancylostoma caninum TaxID=29170 RepID=A0A368FDK8_ANCCA|nr:hypothetical protein ANCCAN_23976 [Ancylostoma caninum]